MSHVFPSSPGILLSTAKLESHSASISQIQKGFYSRGHRCWVICSPQPCSTWVRPKNLSGWQEMWMEFPHQTASRGTGFVYCEGRSKDVGEEEDCTASFTHECQPWFLREECRHRRAAFPCAHLSLRGINWSIQTQREGQFVYCEFFSGEVRHKVWAAGQDRESE